MLNSHPRLAIPYESHFLPDYHRRLGEYGDLAADGNLRRLLADMLSEEIVGRWDHSYDLDRVVALARERSLAGAIDAMYRDYAEGKGKERWGDKSSYMDEIAIINEIFGDAQFIHIIRDGRDVASSVMKQPWGPTDIISAAEWWNDYVWVARRMGAILGPRRYLEVRFEDLLEDVEAELRRVCAFLGEAFHPQMLEYHTGARSHVPADKRSLHYNVDRPIVRSRAGAWQREMHRYDVALFGRYAGKMLGELGYEMPVDPVSRVGMALRVARLGLRRLLGRGREAGSTVGSRG
jgi:hypothetical protein